MLRAFCACVAAAFAAGAIAQAKPPPGAGLEEALNSSDRRQLESTFARVRREAGSVDPVYLMLMAGKMQQLGQNEEAVFWFLAGQLRMRYLLSVSPDQNRSAVFGSLMFSLGTPIYAPYQADLGQIAPIIDRVLAWDRVTPVDFSWLGNRGVLPREQWESRFVPAREGLVKLKTEFLAVPKDECQRLRHGMGDPAKARAQAQQAWASESNRKRAQAGFSTAPTVATTSGLSFRLGKNFISPFGLADQVDFRDREIGVTLFLPDLSGYTGENWVDLYHPQKLQANVLPTRTYPFMDRFAGQVAQAGAAVRESDGLRFYAKPGAHKCFPEEIAAGTRENGEPVYMSCPGSSDACQAYFHGADKAYTVSLMLRRDRLPRWRELVARVGDRIESWRIAAR